MDRSAKVRDFWLIYCKYTTTKATFILILLNNLIRINQIMGSWLCFFQKPSCKEYIRFLTFRKLESLQGLFRKREQRQINRTPCNPLPYMGLVLKAPENFWSFNHSKCSENKGAFLENTRVIPGKKKAILGMKGHFLRSRKAHWCEGKSIWMVIFGCFKPK